MKEDRSKKSFIIVCFCLSFCLLFVPECFCFTSFEIIDKAKKVTSTLKFVKLKGQTTTGLVDVTYEEGLIDYGKRIFCEIDKKNSQIVSALYCKDGIAYLHQVLSDSWFKFSSDSGFASNIFDKEAFFISFPKAPTKAGFAITFAGNETVENEACYRIQSNIFNRELAKQYIEKFLDKFVPQEIAHFLRQDRRMLDDYLTIYTQNPQTTLWIAKDNFFIKKMETKYNQITGPAESIPIRREVIYYDFNKPLKIDIPDHAFNAPTVSLEDMAVNR